MSSMQGSEPPREGTVERWAWEYVLTQDLGRKLAPPRPPPQWEDAPPVRRLEAPGRPPELTVVDRAPRRPRRLSSPRARARLLHTFLHHELQAAELMCWALLAFPDTPRAFREGLVGIALDEVRHMGMYRAHIERLGGRVGEEPVRDWFWLRVPACAEPAAFVSVMGLGLEAANLEHAHDFAARFRAVGDEEGAVIQERVGREEEAHVRFGRVWFERFRGPLTFADWTAALPPPLSPLLMRGRTLHREARARAGFDDDFLGSLEAWQPTESPPGT